MSEQELESAASILDADPNAGRKAGDEGDVRRIEDTRRKAAEREAQSRLDTYRAVLRTPQGRRVLSEIIFEYCGALRVENGAIPEFQQGMKHIGLTLLEQCARADANSTVELINRRNKNE